MNQNLMMIALTECLHTIGESQTIEERLKAAMKITKHHWLVTAEDERLKAAVGAVMQSYGHGSAEWTRLETELKSLAKLSAILTAAQSGIAVDPDSIELPPKDFKPIGIMKMWRETE